MRNHALLVFIIACGGSSEPETVAETESESTGGQEPSSAEPGPPFGLMNGARPADGIYTAGQPSVESLEAAHAAGVRTVISLRTEDEPGQEEELAAIERLGMRFARLPVDGAAGVTAENARALELLLSEAADDGEILLHCGSSNRVGALMALRAFLDFGATLSDAIGEGREAGLTRLEGRVREVLEGICADAPDDARCISERPSSGGD